MSPARKAVNVSPHDTNALTFVPNALYFGGAGTVNLRTIGATTNTTFTVVAGGTLEVRAQYVYATGTNATGIVALL